MTATPDWTIDELLPSAPGTFTTDDLAPLEPLWRSLMDRHREGWEVLPLRPYEDSWPRRRTDYQSWLTVPGSFVLVARRDGRLVGYVVVGIEKGDETYATAERQAEIHTLSLLPGERGRGLGTALMAAVERRLLTDGVTDVFVATMQGNNAAQRFYERRGYAPFVQMNYRKLTGD